MNLNFAKPAKAGFFLVGAVALGLAACSGGGGAGPGAPGGGATVAAIPCGSQGGAGPTAPLRSAVDDVAAQAGGNQAVSGTVVPTVCAVNEVLDVADGLSNGLTSLQNGISPDAVNSSIDTQSLQNALADLQKGLTNLANTDGAAGSTPGAQQLLGQVTALLGGLQSGDVSSPSQLSGLLAPIVNGLQSLPGADAGAQFGVVGSALDNLQATLSSLSTGDTSQVSANLQNLVTELTNELTVSGLPGVGSGAGVQNALAGALANFTGALGGLGAGGGNLNPTAIQGLVSSLLGSIPGVPVSGGGVNVSGCISSSGVTGALQGQIGQLAGGLTGAAGSNVTDPLLCSAGGVLTVVDGLTSGLTALQQGGTGSLNGQALQTALSGLQAALTNVLNSGGTLPDAGSAQQVLGQVTALLGGLQGGSISSPTQLTNLLAPIVSGLQSLPATGATAQFGVITGALADLNTTLASLAGGDASQVSTDLQTLVGNLVTNLAGSGIPGADGGGLQTAGQSVVALITGVLTPVGAGGGNLTPGPIQGLLGGLLGGLL